MIVYHVCGFRKFVRYLENKCIKAPVRAWIDIREAERFSKSTGRPFILRLKFNERETKKLEGHKGKAVFIENDYPLEKLGIADKIKVVRR